MNKKHLLTALLVLLVLGAGGYYLFQNNSASEPKFFPASEVSPNDTVITITDTSVEPAEITIKIDQKVTFVNNSLDFAWPASNPHPTHTDYPEFDPREPLDVNEAWTFTFTKVGEWKYHDHLKPSRRGIIKVTE